jgi:hypothetical protein
MKCKLFKFFYLDNNCVVDKTDLFDGKLGKPLKPFPRTVEVCKNIEDISNASNAAAAAMPGGRRVKCHTRGYKKSRRTRHSKKSRRNTKRHRK